MDGRNPAQHYLGGAGFRPSTVVGPRRIFRRGSNAMSYWAVTHKHHMALYFATHSTFAVHTHTHTHTPAKCEAHPLTRSMFAAHTRLPNGEQARSRAASAHAQHAHTPASKHARSRAASAQSPKPLKSKKACSRVLLFISGTSGLDCTWGALKAWLPCRLNCKLRVDCHSAFHPAVKQQLFQRNWRQTLGPRSPTQVLQDLVPKGNQVVLLQKTTVVYRSQTCSLTCKYQCELRSPL